MSSDYERDKRDLLEKMGFREITRAAGSLGKDLVMRNDKNQFIAVEIKSAKKNRNGKWKINIGNRKKTKQQYREIREAYEDENLAIFYDVRWKGHPDHYGIEDDWERWEAFMIADEDMYISRSNQKWPTYNIGEGISSKKVWKELLHCENPFQTLESLALSNQK